MSVPATTAGFSGPDASSPGQTWPDADSRRASARGGSASSAVSGRRLESPLSNCRVADRAEQDRARLARGGERLVGQRRQPAPKRRAADSGFVTDRTDVEARGDRAQDGRRPRRRLRGRCRRRAATGSKSAWRFYGFAGFYEVLRGSTGSPVRSSSAVRAGVEPSNPRT